MSNTLAPVHTHTHTHTHIRANEGVCIVDVSRGGDGETTRCVAIDEKKGSVTSRRLKRRDQPRPLERTEEDQEEAELQERRWWGKIDRFFSPQHCAFTRENS